MTTSSSLLNKSDEKLLLSGEWLNDTHINLAQQLLSQQFPNLSGLHSTLLLPQAEQVVLAGARALQIIHTLGNYWIVASTIGFRPGKVKIFHSLYKSIDFAKMSLIPTIFGSEITTIHLEDSNKAVVIVAFSLLLCLHCIGTWIGIQATNNETSLVRTFL